MSQPTPRLMILAAMIAIVATIIALVWVWPALREPAIGSLESRQDFHRRQLAFREICQKNSVVGKPVAEVNSLFSGYQPLGRDDTLSWREWPCALVIRHGKVAGVFYHDYPYKMQPLPSDFVTENASPFFERYPQYFSASASTMAVLAALGEQALPCLEALVQNPDRGVRKRAWESPAWRSLMALPALGRLVQCADAEIRESALAQLRQQLPLSVIVLGMALKNPDPVVKNSVLGALKPMGLAKPILDKQP